MKIIFTNLINILKRFRTASLLNIIGLSVAFAAFIVILMQVHYDLRFDKVHSNSDRIYKVDLICHGIESNEISSIHSRAFVDALIASSPHIEAGTLYNPYVGDIYITVEEDGKQKGFRESFVTCYSELTTIFGFEFTEGSGTCLNEPDKVIIPESMARRFWGKAPAVGESIYAKENVWTKHVGTLTVGGVYRDFPDNTQISNSIYGAIDETMKGDWMSGNFICYILLGNGIPADRFTDDFNETFDFSPIWSPSGTKLGIQLMPLTDIHYSQAGGLFKTENPDAVRLLFVIALLIIIIAAINFTNFSIAMAPVRIKNINTRKVFGSSTGMQRMLLITEAMGIALISWILALFLIGLLRSNNWLSFFDADLSFTKNISLLALSAGIAILIGVIAGVYPAWYMTSFQPALVLKGNFATSSSGRFLRTGLVGFQYIISIGLVVAAIFVQLQNHYLSTYDLGFDKDQVAVVELNGDFYKNHKNIYVNRLKEHPGIEDVAFSKQKLGARDRYTTYGLAYEDQQFDSYVLEVSTSFPHVMGIPVMEGRDFLPSDEQPGQLMFMFNKPLQKSVGMEPGSPIDMSIWEMKGYTAGIVGDLKFTSLRQGAENISFMINPYAVLPVSYIRLKAGTDVKETVAYIQKVVAEIDPTYPFELEFYDTIFDQLYKKEISLTKIIMVFSFLAIIISIVGVFGLILFETQFRRKEIGIRRILGSSLGTIIVMFNKTYLYIILAGFVIAAPIAYYAVSEWLENFAYKTPFYWWVFVVALLIVLIITMVTVTMQCWRAATANPVNNIKAE